jgi:glyoxylase-like metal-dependent hydrolase (beta-lactamase superfamily II)
MRAWTRSPRARPRPIAPPADVPHGSREIGAVEVVALCDGAPATASARESFPGASEEIWAETRRRYPDVFDGDGWRLHVHAFVLRTGRRTILVDTGVGPESAPAFGWSGMRGALDRELEAAGVAPLDVDTVIVTHVHDDHIGWNVREGRSEPLFANARYLIHRADWEWLERSEDDEDQTIFQAVLAPLERAGVLDLVDEPVELTSAIVVQHAPGHTPGHQVVLIDSEGELAIVTADLVNNPVMLLQPGVNGDTDADPALAASTRAAFLERIDREDRLVMTSHFPEPFGRFEPDGARHIWRPEP